MVKLKHILAADVLSSTSRFGTSTACRGAVTDRLAVRATQLGSLLTAEAVTSSTPASLLRPSSLPAAGSTMTVSPSADHCQRPVKFGLASCVAQANSPFSGNHLPSE
jgi:hypothetical protein